MSLSGTGRIERCTTTWFDNSTGYCSSERSKPVPSTPAVGLREQRLRKLIAAAGAVVYGRVQRVFPRDDAGVYVADVAGHEPGAEREQQQPDHRERQPAGRDVQQREEGAVEHQRRPELPRDQQGGHGGPPHDQHRPELLHRRAA